MKKLLLALFIIFSYASAFSQTAEIKGRVQHSQNKSVANIEVILAELNKKTSTDALGNFKFEQVPQGFYTLYALYDGIAYNPVHADLRELKTVEVLLSLGDMSFELDAVKLEAKSISEKLKNNAIKADIVNFEDHVHRANSVEDLVNKTPGVKIRNVGGLGSTSNIIVGGFSGNSVKFLYDNIPIDYLGSNLGLTKVPTNAVGRIEVYKGVLPTKVGVDALGSAINIIPKESRETSGSLSYETGSYNTHIGSLNANIKVSDKFFVGTNTFYNFSENNYKVKDLAYMDVETGQTTYIKSRLFHNDFEQTSLEFYGRWLDLSWADLLEFTVNSYSISKDIQNDSFSRARPFGEVYRKENGDFIPSLKYRGYFFDNRLSVNQFLVYSKLDFELFDLAKDVYYDWKGVAHPTRSSSEMGNLILKDGYLKNTLEQYISRSNLNYLLHENFQVEGNLVYSHYNRKSNIDDLNLNGTSYDKLITNLGLNAQLFDQKLESNTQVKYLYSHLSGRHEDSDNPSIGVVKYSEIEKTGLSFSQAFKYNIDPKTYLRFSYENTYRLPEQHELFGDNNFILANYHLKPEKSKNYNLGFTRMGYKYSFEINTYYRDTKELIRLKDMNQYQAAHLNLDEVKGYGIELEANYEPIENLFLSGNITYNDFRLKASKDILLSNQHYKNARVANMPFYYANFSTSYNLKELLNLSTDLSVFWDYSYVHQYYLDFIEKQFEPDGFLGLFGSSKINTSRIIPVQHLNNLGIVYVRDLDEKRAIAFSAELKNIFDADIYNEFKMQSPGRNFRLKITYNF